MDSVFYFYIFLHSVKPLCGWGLMVYTCGLNTIQFSTDAPKCIVGCVYLPVSVKSQQQKWYLMLLRPDSTGSFIHI